MLHLWLLVQIPQFCIKSGRKPPRIVGVVVVRRTVGVHIAKVRRVRRIDRPKPPIASRQNYARYIQLPF